MISLPLSIKVPSIYKALQGTCMQLYGDSTEPLLKLHGTLMANCGNSTEPLWNSIESQWNFMEHPWKLHGTSIKFHGNSMKILWNGNPWKLHGTSMEHNGTPCKLNRYFVKLHGNPTQPPWDFIGNPYKLHRNSMKFHGALLKKTKLMFFDNGEYHFGNYCLLILIDFEGQKVAHITQVGCFENALKIRHFIYPNFV